MSGRSGSLAVRYAAVFYDLDGTLVDSRPGIEASLQVAFAAHLPGVEPPALDTLLGQALPALLRGTLPAGLTRPRLRRSPRRSRTTTTPRGGASAGRIRAWPPCSATWLALESGSSS